MYPAIWNWWSKLQHSAHFVSCQSHCDGSVLGGHLQLSPYVGMQHWSTLCTMFKSSNAWMWEGKSRMPQGKQTSGQWLSRITQNLPHLLSFKVLGSVHLKEDDSKVGMVRTGRLVSHGHWCATWCSKSKSASRTQREQMSPPGQSLRILQSLEL